MQIDFRQDPFPSNSELKDLWLAAWGEPTTRDFAAILSRSLAHVGAYADGKLIGFVNVAWDGGVHAFILDTTVHPEWRRKGIASTLVLTAIDISRDRGALWLHVDYEPHLDGFYQKCGFRPTAAGLINLR